jgi:hypothetical protein
VAGRRGNPRSRSQTKKLGKYLFFHTADEYPVPIYFFLSTKNMHEN